MEDKNTRYIEKLENHLEKTKESSKYASDRFDVLIVSISTTALVITISFVKNLIGDNDVDTGLLKLSWLFFVLTIITNLTSQLTSYFSNTLEEKITRNLIRIERKKEPIGAQDKYETFSARLNCCTKILNLGSFLTLFFAIILIVIFYSNNI